jgi:two-component system, LuxR family, sensor kinase FixL
MTWISIAWPMVAAACLTLGLINLGLGIAQPPRAARLLFSLSALAVAVFSGLELALMRVDTVADCWPLLHWMNVAVGVLVASLAAFIWVLFGTGNKWLALAGPGLYAVALAVDFLPGSSMTYQKITGLRTVETFGGATFNVVEGVPNPWNTFAYLGVLLLLVFVVDASVRLWRRGGRRRAAVVGGGVTFFLLAAGVHTGLVETGMVRTPYLISWAYLGILLAMGYELAVDVFAAAKLAGQLLEGERRMELASDAASLGMWTWDLTRDQIWATSRARSLFGFSEAESLNLQRFMSALHPDDRNAVRRAIDSSLHADRDYEVEYRVPLPDGTIRWIATRGRTQRDSAGKPVLMRGVVFDVSARRRSDLELQQLRGQLAHIDRVSRMGQLASALAHELNQPLGAILRNAEAAELFLQHDPPDLDELRAILADIRKDDQRAGDVIDRLRALLKRRSIELHAVAVGDFLGSVAALMHMDAAVRHVKLEIEAAPELPTVAGDRVHLQQVLINLVLNAMDAVEGAPAEERRVVVRAQRNAEGAVEVAVSDSGHGIAPERLDRVFEPFFTTKANGLGIGLPISHTIIEAHGGRIWAQNNAHKGATFRFTLPIWKNPGAEETTVS